MKRVKGKMVFTCWLSSFSSVAVFPEALGGRILKFQKGMYLLERRIQFPCYYLYLFIITIWYKKNTMLNTYVPKKSCFNVFLGGYKLGKVA